MKLTFIPSGQSSCKDMCYKDPTIRDYKWSSWVDRSPGDPQKSKVGGILTFALSSLDYRDPEVLTLMVTSF
jgi:hypothetical protein